MGDFHLVMTENSENQNVSVTLKIFDNFPKSSEQC